MSDDKKVVALVPKDTPAKDKRCVALSEVRELLEDLEKEDIPYNHAIVILVSDETDSPDKAGFRTATINLPSYESLGVLKLAETALVSRLLG